MRRDYRRWHSAALGREMEMLIFGHGGIPYLVLPTSCGRFFEFENHGMVAAISDKLERGALQLFCVDSVDAESWYNRAVPPRWRIARHVQYENYLMEEVLPMLRWENAGHVPVAIGCSFGGYHAANLALRHPDQFAGFLSMGGIFDPSRFISPYHDADCYFHTPTQYLANLSDNWYFERYRRATYVLATGENDICLEANRQMSHLLGAKAIPHRLDVWGDGSWHDWPCWHRMLDTYT